MKNALPLSLVGLAAALTLSACGQQAETPATDSTAPAATIPTEAPITPTTVAGTITVEDAWCRPTPNGAKAGGCYVILTASADDTFEGVSTDLADVAEIHEMKTEGGVMKMGQLKDGLPMPAGQRTELKPHGNHIMLMGLKGPLVAGQTAKITLDFDKAEDVTVDFQIRTPPVVGGEE